MKKYIRVFLLLLLPCSPVPAVAAPASNSSFDCLIEPNQSIEVRSPVVGLLSKVYVHRGDKVRTGQVIAALEQETEKASTELARFKSGMTGSLKTAETRYEFAKRKFERRRDMKAENFMSAQESDDAEAEMKLAEAEVALAKENQQIARLEWQQQSSSLNLRTLSSPFDGVVVDQLLYPGEVVEPSGEKKSILKLAQLDPLRVHVILPFSIFGQVKPDMTVDILPEAPVGGRYQGRVKMVDKLVDAGSGTFGVFLEVPNATLDVPAGIKCRAVFPFPAAKPIR